MRNVLERTRAEGKPTMLDEPEVSLRSKWLAALFLPLRSRGKYGEPLSFGEIADYLRMRGYEPAELFDWFAIADAAAVEWMAEHSERQRKQATQERARGVHG